MKTKAREFQHEELMCDECLRTCSSTGSNTEQTETSFAQDSMEISVCSGGESCTSCSDRKPARLRRAVTVAIFTAAESILVDLLRRSKIGCVGRRVTLQK